MLAYGLVAAGAGMTATGAWTVHPDSFGTQGPLFYRWASSEPANYTFTVSGTGNSVVRIVTYRGVHPTSPWDDADKIAGATGAIALPSVVVTGADRRLVQMVAKYTNTLFTNPGTATERWDAAAPSSGYGNAGGDEIVGAGATGTRTWTPASGTTGSIGYIIALATSAQTISPTGFDVAVQFGTPTLVREVNPSGFDVAVSFGTPTLKQFVSPSGFSPAVQFGTPSLLREITPTGFDVAVTFGSPTLVQDQLVDPTGFDVAVEFGAPNLSLALNPDGFDLLVQFGTPTLVLDNVLTVTGFDLTIQFGTPTLVLQPVVAGTVYNHETGNPAGAGVEVKLFDDTDTLIATTTTDAGGGFIFYRPIGDTDLYWTLASYEVLGVQYHGVSDRGCAAV